MSSREHSHCSNKQCFIAILLQQTCEIFGKLRPARVGNDAANYAVRDLSAFRVVWYRRVVKDGVHNQVAFIAANVPPALMQIFPLGNLHVQLECGRSNSQLKTKPFAVTIHFC